MLFGFTDPPYWTNTFSATSLPYKDATVSRTNPQISWAIALLAFGLFFGQKALTQKINAAKAAQEEELIRLREQNEAQERQIKDLSANAADMIAKQSQLQQGLIEQQNRTSIRTSGADIRDALKELKRELDGVDESEAGERIRSWIEQ